MIDITRVKQRQNLPYKAKISLSRKRIIEWNYRYPGKVAVSFSGGKDSLVLLHLVRETLGDIPGIFCNTGVEYPGIVESVKKYPNIKTIKPVTNFKRIIEKYGYPIVSKEVARKIHEIRTSEKLRNKRLYGDAMGNGKLSEKWKFLIYAPFKIGYYCCYHLKHGVLQKFQKKHDFKYFVGTRIEESRLRLFSYMKHGCNPQNRGSSTPLAFWKSDDIDRYLHENNIFIPGIYRYVERTGCMFCGFGCHFDKTPNRFQILYYINPKLYEYCIKTLGYGKVLNYIGIDFTVLKEWGK